MSSQNGVHDTFQKALDPFIKPREQVNYIRRVLALYLGSCSHDGPIKQPVSLVDSSHDAAIAPELRGIQREYIEAVSANISARRNHAAVMQANSPRPSTPKDSTSNDVNFVEERIALLKLQTKQERLSAVQKYLDLLIEKPAGSVEFLDPEDMFRHAPGLPSVPKEVVNSIVAQQSVTKPNLNVQVAQLEKTVLRAKLLLRKEEQLLRETRSNAQNLPDVISNGTKLEALNATRTELINWIEAELGKASGSGEDDERAHEVARSQDRSAADSAAVDGQLGVIKDKYARYVSARRSLLTTLSERPEASQPPVLKPLDNRKQAIPIDEPAPNNYLLTPYVESLVSLSRTQKAMITQKSYMTSTLGKETKDACQVLSHIAEESQLLPQHPQSNSNRRRSGLGEVLFTPDRSGFTGRVQPWVNAADSAKIATLEAVAEKVEGGQLALENSMKALREIDDLLGQQEEGGDHEATQEQQGDDDFWMNTGPKYPSNTRRHTEKKKAANAPRDAWSGIHGKLGLIGHGDAA